MSLKPILSSYLSKALVGLLGLSLISGMSGIHGQEKPSNGVVSFVVAENQFATILTAEGYVTRLVLPEEAKKVVCGAFYDAQTGLGSFVVDNTGNDVFIKAVSKATTNLFVKTQNYTFNFYLRVVSDSQAHRVVTVRMAKPGEESAGANPTASAAGATSPTGPDCAGQAQALQEANKELELLKGENAAAKQELDKRFGDIQRLEKDNAALKSTNQEIATKIKSQDQELTQLRATQGQSDDRLAVERARIEQDVKAKLVQAVVAGIHKASVTNRRLKLGEVEINVDENLFSFNEKLYMRFMVQNRSGEAFAPKTVRLELHTMDGVKDIPIQIYEYDLAQPRTDVAVPAKQSATIVIVFDDFELTKKDRLALVLQDADLKVSRLTLTN